LTLITEQTLKVIPLYRHYKNGLLPAGGGILDQTPQFLRAMEIIDAAVGEHNENESRK